MTHLVFISFSRQRQEQDPIAWIDKLDFYTCQLEALAKHVRVSSIHFIQYQGSIQREGVSYQFFYPTLKNISFIAGHIRALQADVILVHGFVFPFEVLALKAQLPQIKLIIIHHAEKPGTFPLRLLQKQIAVLANRYFFAARGIANAWVDQKIIDPQKIEEVMEVSTTFQYRQRVHHQDYFQYLWVGRFDRNKDAKTLIGGFSRFIVRNSKAKLRIIYRGEIPVGFQEMLSDLANVIELRKDCSRLEMEQFYNEASFIISTSHYEGSGTAVCEAMACGCIPIVTSISSFIRMTAQGRVGITFKAGDDEDFLRALERSVDLDLNAERQKVLAQFEEHLSPEAIAAQIIKVVDSL